MNPNPRKVSPQTPSHPSHALPLPAHETKNEPVLYYPVLPTSLVLALKQSDTTHNTTGSTLWLGAQILALYLFDLYGSKPRPVAPTEGSRRPRAIDLGAGVGLTAHVMAMLGFDVVATDLMVVMDTVLRRNIEDNQGRVKAWGDGAEVGGVAKGCGDVRVRELDWFVHPDEWDWSGARSIAPREELEEPEMDDCTSPPFDLIVTADTLYHQDLVVPLLRAIRAISIQSRRGGKFPPVFVALERRDSEVIKQALELAKKERFHCKKVPDGKVRKCLDVAGFKWEREDWEDIEIWRWVFRGE